MPVLSYFSYKLIPVFKKTPNRDHIHSGLMSEWSKFNLSDVVGRKFLIAFISRGHIFTPYMLNMALKHKCYFLTVFKIVYAILNNYKMPRHWPLALSNGELINLVLATYHLDPEEVLSLPTQVPLLSVEISAAMDEVKNINHFPLPHEKLISATGLSDLIDDCP
jgi:hypothetical protein